MNKTPESKQFWRLCGPLLVYWCIQFVARFIVEFAILLPQLPKVIDYETLSSTTLTQDKIMEIALQNAEQLMEILQKYTVEILGVVALFTIPLSLTLFWLDRKRAREANLLQSQKVPVWLYGEILLFGVAFCVGMNALIMMSDIALSNATYQQTSEIFYSASFPVQILCLGVIIPITEELMFRGILFRRYSEKGGFMRAAIGSSMIFGLVHGNWVQIIYAFVLGMFLAYVYRQYGSLKAPIFLHILVNVVSLVLTATGALSWIASNPFRMGMITIMSAFVCSVIFVFLQKISSFQPKPS